MGKGNNANPNNEEEGDERMSTARVDAAKLYVASPYKKAYGEIWADVKDMKGIVTKSELVSRMQKRTGKSEAACSASVGVILSPRETSNGDCRGNFSAKGHLYYFAKLNRTKDADGKKEEQRYRFHWRKDVLPVHKRNEQDEVESKKTAPAKAKTAKTAKTATPATLATPAKATADASS